MSCLITFCYKQNIISRKNNAKVIIFIERGCYPLLFFICYIIYLLKFILQQTCAQHIVNYCLNTYTYPKKIRAKQQLLL